MNFIYPKIFDRIYEYMTNNGFSYENNISWISLCLSSVVFIFSFIAASIFKLTVEKFIKFWGEKMYKKGKSVVSMFAGIILKK